MAQLFPPDWAEVPIKVTYQNPALEYDENMVCEDFLNMGMLPLESWMMTGVALWYIILSIIHLLHVMGTAFQERNGMLWARVAADILTYTKFASPLLMIILSPCLSKTYLTQGWFGGVFWLIFQENPQILGNLQWICSSSSSSPSSSSPSSSSSICIYIYIEYIYI